MKHNGRLLTFEELKKIPASQLPLIVLSDNTRSLLSLIIKAHQKGHYNHSCVLHRPNYFSSQDLVFHEVPIEKYQIANRLKFWTNIYWSNHDKRFLKQKIKEDLAKPWYFRLYDGVGCFLGQGLNLEWLQIPGLEYCSESCANYMRLIDPKVPHKPSPPDLNRWLKAEEQYQRGYRVFGWYIPD